MNNKLILMRMKELGMNTTVLSEITGIPISTVNKIIYGVTTNPTIDNLQQIAKALDCRVDDFIETYEEPETVAAHHDREDWTAEELAEIERFKDYLRSKRS